MNKDVYEISNELFKIYVEVCYPDYFENTPLDILYIHGISDINFYDEVSKFLLSKNKDLIIVRLVYKLERLKELTSYINNVLIEDINKKYLIMKNYIYCESLYGEIGYKLVEGSSYESLCVYKYNNYNKLCKCKVVLINDNSLYEMMIKDNIDVKFIKFNQNGYLSYIEYLCK